MREIKFRAWHKERGRMTPPLTLSFIAKEDVMWKIEGEVREYEWMQYTGLKDKNGVLIYEGDIVLISLSGFGIRKKCVIEWNGNGYGSLCEDYHREVIGNIWQNKETLNDNQ